MWQKKTKIEKENKNNSGTPGNWKTELWKQKLKETLKELISYEEL
jgi:hypothetical protein